MIDNNKPQPKVTITSAKIPGAKSWRCIGYVNGKEVCSVSSKDKAYNEREVRADLLEGGFVVTEDPKVLAPEISMAGKFADVVNKLNPGKKKRTEAFLSETDQSDLRTEYAA